MVMLPTKEMNLFCLVNCYSYQIMLPGLISFVVQVLVFLLQVELDPVVKTNDFCSWFCLANKHMFKSTGVQAGDDQFKNRNTHTSYQRNEY